MNPRRFRRLARRWIELAVWLLRAKHGRTPELAKYSLINKRARQFRTRILIETGTYLGETIVATRRTFDRDANLPPLWSLTAPLGWAFLGVLMLDTTRLALTGRGADWKGRAAPTRGAKVA